jgi:T-complex protein 1 subunit eta
VFCAGRVPEDDLQRTLRACGGAVLTTVNKIVPDMLGLCSAFRETQVGGDRFNFFTGCPQARTCTIIMRGGAEQFIEETERSLHDAIMIVRRAIKNDAVVAGGGAIEMELSKFLRDHSLTISGKSQLLFQAYAKVFCVFFGGFVSDSWEYGGQALEVIPRQLCDNAGFDATDILNKLRHKHAHGGTWFGVDIFNESIADNFDATVWEPAVVKINALTAATEAACLILSVDETITNKTSQIAGKEAQHGSHPGLQMVQPGGAPVRGRGVPRR